MEDYAHEKCCLVSCSLWPWGYITGKAHPVRGRINRGAFSCLSAANQRSMRLHESQRQNFLWAICENDYAA
jgi:hypothetical protein